MNIYGVKLATMVHLYLIARRFTIRDSQSHQSHGKKIDETFFRSNQKGRQEKTAREGVRQNSSPSLARPYLEGTKYG